MNKIPSDNFFEIEVKHFGPIIEGKVDLRPLTVFIGPSNTGKSYLAILIYALHRFFNVGRWRGPRRTYRSRIIFPGGRPIQVPKKSVGELLNFIRTVGNEPEILEEKPIVLPREIAEILRSQFETLGSPLSNEIQRCFGFDAMNSLIQKGENKTAHVVLQCRKSRNATPVEHRLTIDANKSKIQTTIPNALFMPRNALKNRIWNNLFYEVQSNEDELDREYFAEEMMEFLYEQFQPQFSGPLCLPAFYLPADRTGVMHAHSVVVSALIESAAMTGLRPAVRTPMLSGVMADFLEELIDLGNHRRGRHKNLDNLSDMIEKAILDGKVRVQKSKAIGYPRFTYHPKGWTDDLPLMNASSMVSELAPIVLYLRHVVNSGSVLIIEEPESHLHPAMQVEFTRLLAKIVNSGVRVIVTTHSEWLLEELANVVRRSELTSEQLSKTEGREFVLNSDQVGAWLFQPVNRSRGSVVKEINLDDSGLYPSGFDSVAVALHNSWADIASHIEETE